MKFWRYIEDVVKDNLNTSDNNDSSSNENQTNDEQNENESEENSYNHEENKQDLNSNESPQEGEEKEDFEEQESDGEESKKTEESPSEESSQGEQEEKIDSEEQKSDGEESKETEESYSEESSQAEQEESTESEEQKSDGEESKKTEESPSEESSQGEQEEKIDSEERESENGDSKKTEESSSEQSSQGEQGESTEFEDKELDVEETEESSSEESIQESDELNNSREDSLDSSSSDDSLTDDGIEQSILDQKQDLMDLKDMLTDYLEQGEEVEDEEEDELSNEKQKLNSETEEVYESEEQKYELSEQTNQFISKLNELPSFENRDKSPGYAIDTNGNTEIPDSMLRTLLTKFLNQRFCKKNTDLNVRSNSLQKTRGFYKWEVKDVIVHLETEQVTKVLNDKYGYDYSEGRGENVPLSFYFDMSGSMSSYTNLLAVLAIELLKKNVKVLIGFNEKVNVQIESVDPKLDVKRLAKILESAGNFYDLRRRFIKDDKVVYKYVEMNLDNYLISKKAEKCVVFSDFDPIDEVINLSHATDVYWFCFESSFDNSYLNSFTGFIYKVKTIRDIMNGLIKINSKKFEALCYVDNPASVGISRRRVKK